VTVTLLEGSERLVGTARPDHSAYVQRFLEKRGVVVRTGARVSRVDPQRVHLADGSCLDAFTLIWAAGVCPPSIVRDLPVGHAPDGRVLVDEHLHALDASGQPLANVFVIGDCAASPREDGSFQPRLSQTAVAMGSYLGRTLVDMARGRPPAKFHFKDAGYIISLGKHSSVVELFGVPMSGRLAWLTWAAAYLFKMVGFRKQMEVGIDHLTHMLFEHDSSQIMNRRQVLSDEELNLSLQAPPPPDATPQTTRRSS
jgi:NADH dehydrogenase